MAKTFEELATEMTIAWMQAVGNACASGKFSGNWLEDKSVSEMYKTFHKAIKDSVKE